jgi:predicted transcriptional regulator
MDIYLLMSQIYSIFANKERQQMYNVDIDKLNEDINDILTEELGISDNVSRMTDIILNDIISDYRNRKFEKSIIISNGVGVKEGDITVDDVFNNELNVLYKIYNFKDKIYREQYIDKEGKGYLNAGSNHMYLGKGKRRRLVVNRIGVALEMISGTLINVEEAKDSIQHELEHIYQQSMMKKEFGNKDLYRIVSLKLYNGNKYDESVATILYMSFKSEIEAYANGLYAFVKEKLSEHPINIDIEFKKSAAYKKLRELYEAKSFIIRHLNDKEMDDALYTYRYNGVTKEKLIKMAEDSYNEMIRRFGKALVKARKDIINSGVMTDKGIHYKF